MRIPTAKANEATAKARTVAADQLAKASHVVEPDTGSGPRRALWLAALVPVVAIMVWVAKSLRPSAAADDILTEDDAAGATGAPATAAPGQATASGNGAVAEPSRASG
jgi:hypothetical protein